MFALCSWKTIASISGRHYFPTNSQINTLRLITQLRVVLKSHDRSAVRYSVRCLSTKIVVVAKVPKSAGVKISQLSEDAAKLELQSLNGEIERHDKLYYDKNEPEISDAAYDKLLRRAIDITGKYNDLRSLVKKLDTVGARSNERFPSFHHTKPMLSLDNAFKEDELLKFMTKTEKLYAKNTSGSDSQTSLQYIVEPKIDGLSLALHYIDGQLVSAGTRGDGAVGEDVTYNALHFIPSIPRRIATTEKFLEVRGEVFISTQDFAELNAQRAARNESLFSTARNAAAGSLRKVYGKNGNIQYGEEDRKLRFFAYGLVVHEDDSVAQRSKVAESLPDELHKAVSGSAVVIRADLQSEVLSTLSELGFQVAQPNRVCSSANEVVQTCAEFEAGVKSWGYEADGAVLKVNSVAQQQALGEGTKAPKWAVAYKFSGEVVETTIEDIVVQVGRTGLLTPVAQLSPVVVGGVTVRQATLHNPNEVRRLGLFKGARVLLKRAGDVIPKVMGLAPDASSGAEALNSGAELFEMPTHCPVCGSAAELDSNGTLRCSGGGFVCSAQAIEQIRHFCSRDAANIDGVGGARLEFLYNNGYVRNVLDLYLLRDADLASSGGDAPTAVLEKESKGSKTVAKKKRGTDTTVQEISQQQQQLLSLRGQKGWGDRSVSNLLSAIDKSKQDLSMHRLLYGLGVRHVGAQTAKDISKEFGGDFPAFWSYLKSGRSTDHANEDSEEGSADLARLSSINGLGPVALHALRDFAADDRNVTLVDQLLERVWITPESAKPSKRVSKRSPIISVDGEHQTSIATDTASSAVVELGEVSEDESVTQTAQERGQRELPLIGRKVVFTGAMTGMTRKEAQVLCEQLGGEVHGSVTKAVDLLVDCSAEAGVRSVKALKADKLGVEVWTEAQWRALIEKRQE